MHSLKRFLWITISALAFCTCVADASEIKDLHIGKVSITDQNLSTQKQASKRALEQVLIKVSGQREVLNNDLLRRAIRNVEQYLISSGFILIDDSLALQANFNLDKVIDLLRFAKLPVWGSRRPATLLWLATENEENSKSYLNQIENSVLNKLVNQVSDMRGIRIYLPIGDFEDRTNISSFDVWGLFANDINKYSLKYQMQYTLVARISVGFDEITSKEAHIVNWVTIADDTVYEAKSSGATQDEALENFLNDYSDYLASMYSISNEQLMSNNLFSLAISGIDSLKKYADVLDAINSVAVVTSAKIVSQKADLSVFEVVAGASIDDLTSILSLDKRFSSIEYEEELSNLSKYDLRYVWERP